MTPSALRSATLLLPARSIGAKSTVTPGVIGIGQNVPLASHIRLQAPSRRRVRENRALNDAEVALVEPTGVDGVCTMRIEGQRACRRRTHCLPR